MNLEDQLRGDQSGAGSARLTERIQAEEPEATPPRGRRAGVRRLDPYGELKTRVQRAVIPKLGPWLFSNQESPDLRREVDGGGDARARRDRARRSRQSTASA